jgi:hypothetical protein
MHKLKFLLANYARPFYRWLAAGAAVGAIAAGGAAFTAYFAPVAIVVGALAGLVVAAAATLAILVLNVLVAASLQRGIDRFEAAYDAYRRANNIADVFYEEMDLAEAAQHR